MANKKMTRAEALEQVIDFISDEDNISEPEEWEEALKVLKNMHTQLTKPRAASTSKSKTALENEATARKLYEITPAGTVFDSKFVMEHTMAMTPQKVVGIMKVGIALGLFEKFKEGKQTVYRKL